MQVNDNNLQPFPVNPRALGGNDDRRAGDSLSAPVLRLVQMGESLHPVWLLNAVAKGLVPVVARAQRRCHYHNGHKALCHGEQATNGVRIFASMY